MNTELQALLGDGAPTREAIDSFIEERQFPLVDERGVTFVFHGKADRVNLRHFIYGLPSSQPLQRVEGADLWHIEVDLPKGSRLEYKIERVLNGNGEWIMDPLNPRIARDPFGANSVCEGFGYETPDWTRPDPESRQGSFESISVASRAFDATRELKVYLPARFRKNRRYPLLIVHDGEDYCRYAELKVVLDNLIHRLELPSMIVALSDPDERLVEYGADPRHAEFLSRELVPALERAYPLIGEPHARGLMGASFGAVGALHAAWSNPELFGRLLIQSGSFAFSDIGDHDKGPIFDNVVAFVNKLREEPSRPAEKIFLSCGTYEGLIYENRSIVPVLQATGGQVRYVESRDGHNWDNWRDRLREGLSWLFPGPLWMVYE